MPYIIISLILLLDKGDQRFLALTSRIKTKNAPSLPYCILNLEDEAYTLQATAYHRRLVDDIKNTKEEYASVMNYMRGQ